MYDAETLFRLHFTENMKLMQELKFFSISWEFFLIRCEFKGQGCRLCTDCKAVWGKFVISDNGRHKIKWIELNELSQLYGFDCCHKLIVHLSFTLRCQKSFNKTPQGYGHLLEPTISEWGSVLCMCILNGILAGFLHCSIEKKSFLLIAFPGII